MASNGSNPAAAYRPGLYGLTAASILTGITIAQAYIFFNTGKDSWSLRCLVIFLVTLDILGTVIDTVYLDQLFIKEYGILSVVQPIPSFVAAENVGTGVITSCVQFFLGWQIFRLDRRWWPASLLISVFAFGGLILTIIINVELVNLESGTKGFEIIAGTWNAMSALADIMATVSLCIILASAKGTIQKTNAILNSLLVYFINRGILLTVAQILFMVFWYAAPEKLIWYPFHFCLSKLYVNTFLAMLNTRQALKKKQRGNADTSGRSTTINFKKRPSQPNISHDVYVTSVTEGTIGAGDYSQDYHKSTGDIPLKPIPVGNLPFDSSRIKTVGYQEDEAV